MHKLSLIWNKLLLLTTILAFCVVVLGAFVRLSDAGLGCPDWPGCYGTLTVPQSQEAITAAQHAFPDKPLHHAKAWKEMAHRYLAGMLGLLILLITILGFKHPSHLRVSRHLLLALLGLVALQAALGMWTVTLLLKPVIVTAHLLGGMTTLALLCWITHRHIGNSSGHYLRLPVARSLTRVGLLVLFFQIALGGWTSSNYAALACTDFPTCQSLWWPDMDFLSGFQPWRALGQDVQGAPLTLSALVAIQWTHRLGALITFLVLLVLVLKLMKSPQLRDYGMLLLLLLVIQISLGIGNLILHLPLVIAVSHNAAAALLLLTLVIINSKITWESKRGHYEYRNHAAGI